MNGSPNRKLDRAEYRPGLRYLAFLGIVLAMFLYLVSGLVNLQIQATDDYQQSAKNRRTEIEVVGTRAAH